MGTYAITGAASGICAAVVDRLGREGHRTIGIDVQPTDIVADLGSSEGRQFAAKRVAELCGGSLDGVVSGAGLGPYCDPEPVLRVNFFGALAVLDDLKPLLTKGTEPAAVAISSIGAIYADVIPELARILRAGKNVVSTAMIHLIYPPHANPKMRDPLEKACQIGGSTLYVNGIDPGFSGDALPLTALQLTDQVEEIRVQELVDYSTYEDPDFTGVTFGFGRPESFEPIMGMPGVLRAGWGSMVRMIADAIGVELDDMRETYERRFAPEAFDTPMMHVAKDTCCAVRFQLEGIAFGRPVVVTEHVNRLGERSAPEWPQPPAGRAGVHRCIVTGNPGVQLECYVTGEDGDHNTGGVQGTAMRVINAIPAVCSHAPGLVSTLDLPFTGTRNVRPRLG
jgi:hypothetical protein